MCLCVTAGRATPWNPAQPAAPIHISVSAYMYPVHIVYTPLEPRRRSVESGIMCVCVDIIIMVWFMFIVCFMQPYTCSSFQSSFPFLIPFPFPWVLFLFRFRFWFWLLTPPCNFGAHVHVLAVGALVCFDYYSNIVTVWKINKFALFIFIFVCFWAWQWLRVWVLSESCPEISSISPQPIPLPIDSVNFFPQQSLLVIFPTINKANYALKRGSEGRFI